VIAVFRPRAASSALRFPCARGLCAVATVRCDLWPGCGRSLVCGGYAALYLVACSTGSDWRSGWLRNANVVESILSTRGSDGETLGVKRNDDITSRPTATTSIERNPAAWPVWSFFVARSARSAQTYLGSLFRLNCKFVSVVSTSQLAHPPQLTSVPRSWYLNYPSYRLLRLYFQADLVQDFSSLLFPFSSLLFPRDAAARNLDI